MCVIECSFNLEVPSVLTTVFSRLSLKDEAAGCLGGLAAVLVASVNDEMQGVYYRSAENGPFAWLSGRPPLNLMWWVPEHVYAWILSLEP